MRLPSIPAFASLFPAIPSGTHLTALLVVICFSAGLNVYATVAMLGLLSHAKVLALPASLRIVDSWYVIAICGVLFVVEFVGDKIRRSRVATSGCKAGAGGDAPLAPAFIVIVSLEER